MYYIKIFGRMLELQNKKVGRTISRPQTLRAAKMHVKKHFSNCTTKIDKLYYFDNNCTKVYDL